MIKMIGWVTHCSPSLSPPQSCRGEVHIQNKAEVIFNLLVLLKAALSGLLGGGGVHTLTALRNGCACS